MKLELITDLNESRQYRTRQDLAKTNAREIADHAFMDTIVLWILYNEYDFVTVANRYAEKTVISGGFSMYRQSATDLYMAYHVITQNAASLIGSTEADESFLAQLRVPERKLVGFLRKLAKNQLEASTARQVLQELERSLKINDSNYRSVRRLSQDWLKLSKTQKSLTVTRIIQFYRAHAPKAELFYFIKQLAARQKLEIKDAANPEIPSSKKASALAKTAAAVASGYAGYSVGKNIGKGLL